ncbi:MAG: ABC transporter permease [Candidatus Limnocylindrales bacterium]
MAAKEFRELSRDRRTVAMLIALPILLLVVFGFAASFDVSSIKTIVVGPQAQQFAAAAEKITDSPFDIVDIRPADGEAQAEDALRRGEATVVVVADPKNPAILIDGSDLFGAKAAVIAFANISARAGSGSALAIPMTLPTPRILFNPDLKTSTIMVPALAGMILVFIGTIATSLGVVRERQSGTLEQLAVMPFRPADVFVGKILPYLILAVLDMTLVIGAGMLIFGVPFNGNPLVFALGAALFLFVTLGMGVLVSTVSETQGQAIQLAMMTMLPQILLSGLIFPLDSIVWGVRWIAYFLPLTYFVQIARGVLVRGAPIDSLVAPLVALAILGTLVFGLSILRFRRDLAPAGPPRRKTAVETTEGAG